MGWYSVVKQNEVLCHLAGDDTLKLWDIRNFKKPLVTTDNLPNLFSMYVKFYLLNILSVYLKTFEYLIELDKAKILTTLCKLHVK